MILGYDSEKMSCILHEFDAKHASAYIDFWFHKGREHLSPWREFRVCLIHRQLPHSSRDIAHLFFFLMWGGLVYHLLETFSNFKCTAQIWLTRLGRCLFICIVCLSLCMMCPCEGLHLSRYPMVKSCQACQPGGHHAADVQLTHTHRKKSTHTHTQTYIKFLDTEGGTVCFMPVPEVVGGHQLTATVIDLSPWVEYEFRVLASNTIGTGEPSKPSKQARTKGTCMYRMSRKNVLSPLLKMYSMFVSSPLAWRMSLTSSFLQRNGNNGWVQAWRCIFLPRFSWEDWYYCHVC